MNIIEVIKSGDYLILDTETTGLHSGSEICQIAIINSAGQVLMDTLVKPVYPIPAEATAIHGITNEMVADVNSFPYFDIAEILRGQNVVIYNSDYDVTMLYRSTTALTKQYFDWPKMATWYCAMKHFAQIYGDWNPKYKSYRWQKLDTACAYYKIENKGAHSALADCLATLEVCKAMVGNRQLNEVQGKLPF